MTEMGGSQNVMEQNITRIAANVRNVLETPEARLGQIELLICVTTFLLMFLLVGGSFRRICKSSALRIILWTAYTLSAYLITYTLGLMHSAPFRNDLFPIWAMLLVFVLGSADTFSAYSLEDIEQWKRYNWQLVVKAVWLSLLVSLYTRDYKLDETTQWMLLTIWSLYVMLVVKADERGRALMSASKTILQKNVKYIADHMKTVHATTHESYVAVPDQALMRRFQYVVRGGEEKWENSFQICKRFCKEFTGEKEPAAGPAYKVPFDANDDKIVTVDKVWGCDGRLLNSEGDPGSRLKDRCLSFALFRLLTLRYTGYLLPEDAHRNMWFLFRDGILSEEDGYNRAFRIIEVELVFLFGQFYTKYPIIFQPKRLWLKLGFLIEMIIGCIAAISVLKSKGITPEDDVQLQTSNGVSIDGLVTGIAIIVIVSVELLQMVLLFFSEWAKVLWICKYVQKKSWQHNRFIVTLIRLICRVRPMKPWRRKLRQYDLLKSYKYRPWKLFYNEWTAIYIDLIRDGQDESKSVSLSEEVKRAVMESLLSNDGRLSKGNAALRTHNKVEGFAWACNYETVTQVIMVWHIATSMCELEAKLTESSDTRHYDIATSLSRYLAYLVAFSPKLLPDHGYVSEYVFDQIIIEARNFFKGCKTLESRIRKLRHSRTSESDPTVVGQGVRLGNQLRDENRRNPEFVWNFLADFWAELVLYVAPSEDMPSHLEHLTMGGEFVTHLWVLLYHVGINRDPDVPHSNS